MWLVTGTSRTHTLQYFTALANQVISRTSVASRTQICLNNALNSMQKGTWFPSGGFNARVGAIVGTQIPTSIAAFYSNFFVSRLETVIDTWHLLCQWFIGSLGQATREENGRSSTIDYFFCFSAKSKSNEKMSIRYMRQK